MWYDKKGLTSQRYILTCMQKNWIPIGDWHNFNSHCLSLLQYASRDVIQNPQCVRTFKNNWVRKKNSWFQWNLSYILLLVFFSVLKLKYIYTHLSHQHITMPVQAPQWTEFLLCPICTQTFEETVRRPISLGCGHTVCKMCLNKLHRKACPFDQTAISTDIEQLPVNTALLQLVGGQVRLLFVFIHLLGNLWQRSCVDDLCRTLLILACDEE